MSLQRLLLCGTFVCLFGALAEATPITVTSLGGYVPVGPGTTDTIQSPLPVLLGPTLDTIFAKFRIENMWEIEAITSIKFTVTVTDDEVDGGETGEISFAQPSTNIIFSPGVTKFDNHHNAGPVTTTTLTYNLTADQIAQVIPSIAADGNFRIRIERTGGDFVVNNVTAELEGTFAPEPGSALLVLAAGLCVGAGRFRFNRRTS